MGRVSAACASAARTSSFSACPYPICSIPKAPLQPSHEIIDLVLQGLTAKEIAERRAASLRTVTTQLGTIFRKASVNSQAELIAMMTEGPGTEDR